MADSSLDDFFAKKDKRQRKPKGKPESTSSGDIEENVKLAKKEQKKRKDKDKENVASGGQTNVTLKPKEDEEWKDFEEEREIDYTGLRIQTLKMSKDDQDKDGGDGNGDRDDEDENKTRRDGASGPWNKPGGQGPTAPAVSNVQLEVTKEEPAQKVPGKYVPPAQRLGASAPSASKMSASRKKKDAPNVNSEEDFPTLGGMPGSKKGWSQQYSSTASSDLIDNPNQRRGVNLTLENKFSALQD